MTQGYSNAIVNIMLGWLKGLASWVLKLFNLAGNGGSPLLWLSENWLKLLILLMIIGIGMDWLVWMVRWRPYWVWFRKKRIIVNDEKFFADEKYAGKWDDGDGLFEREYVVPSTVVRHEGPHRTEAVVPQRKKTEVKREVPQRGRVNAVVPGEKDKRPAFKKEAKPQKKSKTRTHDRDIFTDAMFEVGQDRGEYADFYEDEVFDVSNLPEAEKRNEHGHKRRK